MEDILIRLNSHFQKKIFTKLVKEEGSSFLAGEKLKIPASSIRAYKNLNAKLISKSLLEKLVAKKLVTRTEIKRNTLNIFSKKQIVMNSLLIGRKKNLEKIKSLKQAIPNVEELIINQTLNVKGWFLSYSKLFEIPNRKFKLVEFEDHFNVSYLNFAKTQFKEYTVKLPNKIVLNEDFSYFFGLWCGDKSGGKRFGICNQNKQIHSFTEDFLISLFQKPEKIFYSFSLNDATDLIYDKRYETKKSKGWVLSVYSQNGIFVSFFNHLLNNLEEFMKYLDKNHFFAGLFDAEGNVSLYNRSFRWACKNAFLVKIYLKELSLMKLTPSYDGGCLISYNLVEFKKRIFPFLKHSNKLKDSDFLLNGTFQNMPENIQIVLNYIQMNPLTTQILISKALKKNKVYSELGLLENFRYISKEGYPYQYKLIEKKTQGA